MNFITSLVKSAVTDEPEKAAGEESGGGSTTELFASAKVLAEAAKSHSNKDGAKVNNKKVAEAAADELDAAQKYGKLDETQGVGQYIEKAETYLHQYGSGSATEKRSGSATEKRSGSATEKRSGSATEKPRTAVPKETKAPPAESAPVAEGDHEEEEKSGVAAYLKMAGDFFGKE